jgi:peptidyl-prolyl cis-trans isomerase D
VNAILAADETSFEEAAPGLRAEIADERARDAIGEILTQIEDLVAGGATVADLAEQTDLEAGEIAWSEGATEGPAAYQEFREAAQAAQENDIPQVVELSDGGVIALQLDGVTAPVLRPIEEVQAELRKAWDAEALRDAILTRAEEAAQAIAQGASFEDQGLTAQTQAGVNRRDPIEGTPADFSETVFSMETREARALPAEDGAIVLRLDAVEAAPEDDENVAAERDAITSQVSSSIANDLFQAFERQLQANTEVRLDDRAISAVNAQMN